MSAGLDCAYAEAPSAGVERACDDAALAEVAELVAAAFGVAADAALPEPLQDVAGADAWLLRAPDGRALSAVVATVDPDLLALWSAATPPPARRRGHAARLLRAVLGHYACEGVPTACVVATADGEPLYRSLGFAPAEPLRLWMKR
jgi:ribosomal protein S18 acetylase RimI-like enzyme